MDVSLRKLAEESAKEDRKEAQRSGLSSERSLFGYIRVIQTLPLTVIAFTEAQVNVI